MNEAADKALLVMVGLALLVPVFAYRVGRFGRLGLPRIEGAVPLMLSLFVWLGTAAGSIPFTMALLAMALSVPLMVYGWAEIREAVGAS